jgi:hypothetical protein
MIQRWFILGGLAASVWGQQPPVYPPNIPPAEDTVVVTIDGLDFKKSDLEKLMRAVPSASRNFYPNKKSFLEQFALMVRVAGEAEKAGIDKQFPYADVLKFNRMQYLTNVVFNEQGAKIPVPEPDVQKYYAEHKNDFVRAKVRVIYVAFNDNPLPNKDPKAKKPLSSAEAEKKAADLVAKLRAGADFAALVKLHSDDEESKAKGGEMPDLKPNDPALSPVLKLAVFALAPGRVTDPIRQPNGYYIFRMEELVEPQLAQLRDEIINKIRDERFRLWVESVRKSIKIEFKDPKYLADPNPVP